MSVVVVSPRSTPVVSLELAKAHLRVDGDDEDTLIAQHIETAIAALDGPDGWLNRALAPQTLELRLSDFDLRDPGPAEALAWRLVMGRRHAEITLPCQPIGEVASITYVDGPGADQVLDPSLWRATAHGVAPARGHGWPYGWVDPEAVRIRYGAGYAAGEVPAPIVQGVLLMVGDLYANREAVVLEAGKTSVVLNPTAEALLEKYRFRSA